MKKVKFIAVHAADSKTSMNVTVDDLHDWHVVGKGWSDIGYHWFIKFDATLHACRPEQKSGAHERKINNESIAICIEGGFKGEVNFTFEQLTSLMKLIAEKKEQHPNAAVVGHNHFRNDKLCPVIPIVEVWEFWLSRQDSWFEYSLQMKGWCR